VHNSVRLARNAVNVFSSKPAASCHPTASRRRRQSRQRSIGVGVRGLPLLLVRQRLVGGGNLDKDLLRLGLLLLRLVPHLGDKVEDSEPGIPMAFSP
jgi:hypothetical protein